MKKPLALILAFIMCLTLCACGTSDSNTKSDVPNESPKPSTTPSLVVPYLSTADAETIAEDYVDDNILTLELRAGSYNSEIESVATIDIGTVSVKSFDVDNNSDIYDLTIKGTFFAEDDFGTAFAKYAFTWTVELDYAQFFNGDEFFAWSNDRIAFSKLY